MFEFLSKLIKPTSKFKQKQRFSIEKDILRAIGYHFYSNKLGEDLSRSCITGVMVTKFDSNRVDLTIELKLPGLFIGKKGKNINSLVEYLNKEFQTTFHLNLIENTIDHDLNWYKIFNDEL